MKIIDCFTFYNEMDMLFYRLSVLEPFVDYFILVEATHTFIGNQKRLFYQENKQRYERFAHKIIHVIDNELNPNPAVNPSHRMDDGTWKNENHQRNSVENGIRQLSLNPEDLLIIGDLDEIPNPQVLKALRENPSDYNIEIMALSQDMYYYNLTVLNVEKWFHCKIMSYDYYVKKLGRVPQKCRMMTPPQCIERGGWHMSYFGNSSFIRNKIKEFAHQEWNKKKYTDIPEIQKRIQNKEDLFGREHEKWVHIPIENNHFLPPRIDLIPQNYSS